MQKCIIDRSFKPSGTYFYKVTTQNPFTTTCTLCYSELLIELSNREQEFEVWKRRRNSEDWSLWFKIQTLKDGY